jgi:hypothetical protein
MSLAAFDTWTLAAAKDGLEHGLGPFWDASQLCGRPLFGVWGQPWSSPLALLVLGAGRWPLAALAALGTGLLWSQGPRQRWTLGTALFTLAALLGMPLGFVAALALAPWVLLAFWRAPWSASVAILALFLSVLHPPLSLAVLGLAYLEERRPRAWAQRVGWALALTAPAWLPLFFRGTLVLELGRAWPLAAPSEWAGGLAWSCSVGLLRGFPRVRPLAAVGAVSLALALAVAAPRVLARAKTQIEMAHYNQAISRYQDGKGSPEALAQAFGRMRPATVVGCFDGRGSLAGLRRWQRLAQLGAREPDLLSLSNVGWVDAEDGQSGRWNRPVAAALVDGAVLEGDHEERWTGLSLFERPLKVTATAPPKEQGSAWHILNPESVSPGQVRISLPVGHQGGWLFVSQSLDPGWQAQALSGAGLWSARTIHPAEGGFMALPVETGVQSVLFQVQPPLLPVALALALLALAILAWKDRAFLAYRR